MSGLHDAFDDLVADVPVYGDLDRAIEQAEKEQRRRYGVVAGLVAAAAVVAVVVGLQSINGVDDRSDDPVVPPPTPTESAEPEVIPLDRSGLFTTRQVGNDGLEVAGETVPGRWTLNDSVGDVWVAMNIGEDDYESQWWGKGTTTHQMPPAMGQVLRGGVVISPDGHWIVWTRPSADVNSKNPPRVMEVVDTATGDVRWSRNADDDAVEHGALAVTNDGVVVFAHCLKPVFDSYDFLQCDDARVDAWFPQTDITKTLPAAVQSSDNGPPGTVTSLVPLVQQTGAHNGLLVQGSVGGPQEYLRLSARGDIDLVATLPRNTLAVTADERFALLPGDCDAQKCRWTVQPLDGGERAPMLPPRDLQPLVYEGFVSYAVERDDLLLVSTRPDLGGEPTVARCSLAQAQCVDIRP